jgi:hypothetical protein
MIQKTKDPSLNQISDNLSKRIYSRLYESQIKSNTDFKASEKILYHPDLTKADYTYVTEKIQKNHKLTLYTTIGMTSVFFIFYFKTNLGLFLK